MVNDRVYSGSTCTVSMNNPCLKLSSPNAKFSGLEFCVVFNEALYSEVIVDFTAFLSNGEIICTSSPVSNTLKFIVLSRQ